MSEELAKVNTSDTIKTMVNKINSIIEFVEQNNYSSVEVLNSTISSRLPKKLYVFANKTEVLNFTDFEEGDVCEIYSSDGIQGKVTLYQIVKTADLQSTEVYIPTGNPSLSGIYITAFCTENGGELKGEVVSYRNLTQSLQNTINNKLDKYTSENEIQPVLMKQIRSSETSQTLSSDYDTVEIGGSPLVSYDYTNKCVKMTSENNKSESEVRINFSTPIKLGLDRKVVITTKISYGKESGHFMMYLIGTEPTSETISFGDTDTYSGHLCAKINAYGTLEQVLKMEGGANHLAGQTSLPSYFCAANNGLSGGTVTIKNTIDGSKYSSSLQNDLWIQSSLTGNQFSTGNWITPENRQIAYLAFKSNYMYSERSCYIRSINIKVTSTSDNSVIEEYSWDFSDSEHLQYSSEVLYDVPYVKAEEYRLSTNETNYEYGQCALMKFNLAELSETITGDKVLKLVTEQCKNCNAPVRVVPFNTEEWSVNSSYSSLRQNIIDSIATGNYKEFTPSFSIKHKKYRVSDKEVVDSNSELSDWISYINITDWVNEAISNGDTYMSLLIVASSSIPNQAKFFASTVSYTSYGDRNEWMERFGIPLSMSVLKPEIMGTEYLGLTKRLTEHIKSEELDHPNGSITMRKLNSEVTSGFLGTSIVPVLIEENPNALADFLKYTYSVFLCSRDVYGELDGSEVYPSNYLVKETSGDYSGWYYLDLTKVYDLYGAEILIKCEFNASSSYTSLVSTSTIEVKQVGTKVYFSSMPRAFWGTIIFGTSNEVTMLIPAYTKFKYYFTGGGVEDDVEIVIEE